MQLFSTILPIKNMTPDGFIEMVINWNKGGHQDIVIPDVEWHGERNIRYGDDRRWLQIEEYRNQNIIAVRFENIKDDGVVWDTDYVMNFRDMKIAVTLDRSYLEGSEVSLGFYYTPAFIALLIRGGYVESDNGLATDCVPLIMDDSRLGILGDLVNGRSRYNLPVVYVSKCSDGTDAVDSKELAKRLKGAAHVLLQAEHSTNNDIRVLCQDKNEYNGAVGVYYPDGTHSRVMRRNGDEGGRKMMDIVCANVHRYVNSLKSDPLYTWQGVMNAMLLDRYASKKAELQESESAREKSEAEAQIQVRSAYEKVREMLRELQSARISAQESQDLVESVDQEMEEMRRQIESLVRQNQSLSSEISGLRTKIRGNGSMPVLYHGLEEDMYPGEIRDFIIRGLNEYLKNGANDTSRSTQVLRDVIRNNSDPKRSLLDEKAGRLKKILETYDRMTPEIRQELTELGFTVTDGGKHYKLFYHDDNRYWFTLPKTPSDHRSGKNAAAALIKLVF